MLLSEEELIYYNMAISGSRLEQNKYKVLLKTYTISSKIAELNNQNPNKKTMIETNKYQKRDPNFHTCFSSMDIDNIEGFLERYMKYDLDGVWNSESKKNYIDLFKSNSGIFSQG